MPKIIHMAAASLWKRGSNFSDTTTTVLAKPSASWLMSVAATETQLLSRRLSCCQSGERHLLLSPQDHKPTLQLSVRGAAPVGPPTPVPHSITSPTHDSSAGVTTGVTTICLPLPTTRHSRSSFGGLTVDSQRLCGSAKT